MNSGGSRASNLSRDGPSIGRWSSRRSLKGDDVRSHSHHISWQRRLWFDEGGTFLRYTAETDALQQVLQFLDAECCTRNKALKPEQITNIAGREFSCLIRSPVS
jgi:hypothetical protein